MARHRKVGRREIEPDTKYQSKLFTKVLNFLMHDGKKSVAEKVLYGAMDLLDKKGLSSINVLKQAVENAKPLLEVRARRVGGANYQVPVEVRPERRLSLAIRWLVASARARGERTMMERVAAELAEAASNTGSTVRKREEMHKMAEANRAFAHYRW